MLKSIGFGVLLVFMPLGFLGLLALLQFLWTLPMPWGGLLLCAAWTSVHYQRGDRFFLEQLTRRSIGIYGVEYLLGSAPILFFFGRWGQWWNVLIVLIGIFILALLQPPYRQQQTGQQWAAWFPVRWVPPFLWEWRSGLRQQGWWMVSLYMGAFLGSTYSAVAPALVLILAFTVGSFYKYLPPKEILQANNKDRHFLVRKIRQSVLLFQGLLLPHYALFLFFQGSYQALLGALFLFLISSSWISFSCCLAYSSYTYRREKVRNVVPLAIFVGGSFIPFLWPLLPFFWIHYWRKAQQQLHYYA